MTQAADPIIELERITAAHWRAPVQEYLGEWLLRAAGGFTGRANPALPLGDPGMPLADAVTAVTAWYRARGPPPMIAVPQPLQDAASPLEIHLAERKWVPRPAPAFVMTARISDIPPPSLAVHLAPEPDDAWCRLYRYRGNPLPPIARTLLTSAPSQTFATIRLPNTPRRDSPHSTPTADSKGPWGPRRHRAAGAGVKPDKSGILAGQVKNGGLEGAGIGALRCIIHPRGRRQWRGPA